MFPDRRRGHAVRSSMERFSLRENFEKHRRSLFVEHRRYLVFFLVSALLDAASTTRFMYLVGPGVESNFVVRQLSISYGYVAGPLLGKLTQLFAVWGFSILTPRLARMVCLVAGAINLAAALINVLLFR